jgi:dipeptidyl aminopeptidase/acylaminoacyl peptidase
MSELDERLRTLDRLTPPDLWPQVLEREPRKPTSDTGRRVAAAVLAIAAAAAGLGVAWWAVGRGGPRQLEHPGIITPRVTGPKGNGLIAFLAGRLPGSPFGSTSMYVMRSDGTEIKQLITEGGSQAPAWSPDGTRIAFIRPYGEFPPDDLFVMDADGGNVHQLTHTDQHQVGVSWSPDGAWLAVGRGLRPDRDYDLWLVRADGSSEHQLTSGPRNDIGPLWSPDGANIAFSASPAINDSNGTGVFVMHADGTGIHQLTPYEWDRALAWSPDGQQILFLRRDTQLMVMARDGSGQRMVYGCSGACQILSAAWSPDGKELLVSVVVDSDPQPKWDLVEMQSDGSDPHPLPAGDQSVCCASWQPLPPTTS